MLPRCFRLVQMGRRRTARRRPKHHFGGPKIRELITQRPKKPESAYAVYIRSYFRTETSRSFSSHQAALLHAGRMWRSEPSVRSPFEAHVAETHNQYHRELDEWKRHLKAVKRPGNAYIQFAKDLWVRDRGNRTFAEFRHYAGGLWRGMNEAERAPWLQVTAQAKLQHQDLIFRRRLGSAHT